MRLMQMLTLGCLLLVSSTNRALAAGVFSPDWSADSGGLRARLSMRYAYVTNGTGTIVTYLELSNVTESATPKLIKIDRDALSFRVTDGDGNPAPAAVGAFDGVEMFRHQLILPMDSSIRCRIGPCGWGIPKDQLALLDLGSRFGWTIPHDNKTYYLDGILQIAKNRDAKNANEPKLGGEVWHGKLVLPRIRIPTKPDPVPPEELGRLIESLGTAMLSEDSKSNAARQELSLIDDPRVIPWYIKAVRTPRYDLKFAALDRLSRFESDEALEGLRIGMATQSKDIGNCSSEEVAKSAAANIRHSAAIALSRSPHPQSKSLLFSMADDPSYAVRITVLHTASQTNTESAREQVKRMTGDSDSRVRDEARRLLTE